jgi:hypothetical protein
LKAVRLGLLQEEKLRSRALDVGSGLYTQVLQDFLIDNDNTTWSLKETSAVASLSGDVSPEVSPLSSRPRDAIALTDVLTVLCDSSHGA